MIAMLLWIVGCYGLAVAAVHLAHKWQKLLRGAAPAPWMHVVIVTENDERHMEWLMRAYSWYAWLKGRRLHFTVVDCGSTDATIHIAALAAQGHGVSWQGLYIRQDELETVLMDLQQQQAAEEILIVVQPRRKEDWTKVPFVAGSAM